MPEAIEVHVVPRNLRWEVRVNGVARPLVDWFCTKERAIDHAHDRARETDATVILVESSDWTVEYAIHLDRSRAKLGLAA